MSYAVVRVSVQDPNEKVTNLTSVSLNETVLHFCATTLTRPTWTFSACTQRLTVFPLIVIGAFTTRLFPLNIFTFLTYTILLLLAMSLTTILKSFTFAILLRIFTLSTF